jgi:archaea-specific DNA-binding protein
MGCIQDDNIVFVGNKPVMNYVLAVVTQFNNGAEEVIVKARGKAISRAVDTTEIALNRFLQNIEKKSIQTSTEVVDTESGKTHVSSIEIILISRK